MSVTYNPNQFTKGALGIFMQQMLAEAPNWVDQVATVVSSTSADEDYSWMGEAKQLEEAIAGDELPFQPLSDATYKLANKKYWNGLAVKREDIMDEKVGGIDLRIRQMAQNASWLPNSLLSTALINGTSTTLGAHIFAGAFFATAHAARDGEGGTQSNLLTGTGTTVAQIQADLQAALAAVINFKGENGEPNINAGAQRFYMMVPPAMAFDARTAISASIISNTSNVMFDNFAIDVIANPYLTTDSVNDWYLGVSDSIIKGLVFQTREPVTFEAQENAESDATFTREEYRYKVRGRMRAGYGMWQKLVKTNNA